MTSSELARRLGLHAWEADFIRRHPDFLLRPDVEEQLPEALKVPKDWPDGEYSDEVVRERLAWFLEMNEFAILMPDGSPISMRDIGRLDHETRRAILSLLEKNLRSGLRKKTDER
jgi:hypothetical protein